MLNLHDYLFSEIKSLDRTDKQVSRHSIDSVIKCIQQKTLAPVLALSPTSGFTTGCVWSPSQLGQEVDGKNTWKISWQLLTASRFTVSTKSSSVILNKPQGKVASRL